MNNEGDIRNNSDCWSPFDDVRWAWDEVYDLHDYEMCSECEDSANKLFDKLHHETLDIECFDFPDSFVSFDFENLFPQRVTACSVGMVKYKNGEIVDKYYTLIRPPFEYEGKRGPALTWIHGFTEDMFENERTFDEILPEMEAFIEGLPLVAHNACVERACIHDACAFYNIETSIPYDEIMDTYYFSKAIENKLGMAVRGASSHSLNVVCQRFGVKELHHHHACDDAEMCGNLFLVFPKFLSGEMEFDTAAWENAAAFSCNDKTPSDSMPYRALASKGHSILRGDILQKDLTNADPNNNPFYDRIVVITGIFNIERMELAQILKGMGADINTSVGGKMNYLLVGNEPGPSKLKKVDELIALGKDIRKIYQEDLDLILAGECYELYRTEKPVPKPKTVTFQERKTTWPQLVEKFKQYVDGENIVFNERELQSEDYRLLSLYYKQQQKIPKIKDTVLANLRQLDEETETEFRKEILSCFNEEEILTKENACERMQKIFTKYGLLFKAKTCVLTEFGVEFEEYKLDKVLHLTIKTLPQS